MFIARYTEAGERIKQNNPSRGSRHNDQNFGLGKKIYKIFHALENGLTNPLRVYLNWLRRGSTKFLQAWVSPEPGGTGGEGDKVVEVLA